LVLVREDLVDRPSDSRRHTEPYELVEARRGGLDVDRPQRPVLDESYDGIDFGFADNPVIPTRRGPDVTPLGDNANIAEKAIRAETGVARRAPDRPWPATRGTRVRMMRPVLHVRGS
jgi:hypothetical protein